MKERYERHIGSLLMHLERLDLAADERDATKIRSNGYLLALRSPLQTLDEVCYATACVAAARGDYQVALERLHEVPLHPYGLLSQTVWNRRYYQGVEASAAWDWAGGGGVSTPPEEGDMVAVLTQGEMAFRTGDMDRARRCFQKVAQLRHWENVPYPGGMARAWLRKLDAIP